MIEFLNDVNMWTTYVFYYVGTPMQGLFVVLYLTRPWRKYGPTRAVMNKSFSLFLVMFNSLLVLALFGQRSLDWPWWLLLFRILSEAYLLGAIFYQLWVNFREIREGYKSRTSRDFGDAPFEG